MNVPPGLVDAMLATASDAIIAPERAGLVSFWNPGAGRIFGFSADEAIGRSLDLIIPHNLQARHWAGFSRVMETGDSRYLEFTLKGINRLANDRMIPAAPYVRFSVGLSASARAKA